MSIPLERVDKYIWRIPKYKPGMRVPGMVFADDDLLEKMKTDKTLEQCANVAYLPGIYKYSITLPDGHEGYGFPIGGVAATDYEEGVVSPGGVGYDINCLTPETKVLTEYGYHVPIRNLVVNGEVAILCLGEKKNIKPTRIVLSLCRRERQIYRIITNTGLELKATADHPILTPNGMVKASALQPGMKVATYSFEGVEYEKPEGFMILDAESFSDRGIKRELKKRDLLPLYSYSPKLPILLKILGYFFGDGSFNGKKVWFYGSFEGLKEIADDIRRLGYKPSRILTRIRMHEISGKRFLGIEHSLYVSARSFRALLEKVGAPSGKKTSCEFEVPCWIMKLPKWLKRLFLAAYFGAEMNKPQTVNGYNFEPPVVSITKEKSVVSSGYGFLKGIAELLEEFGVGTCGIREEFSGDKVRLKLQFSEKPGSLLNLWSKIGYIYCPERQRQGVAAVSWLRWKRRVISEREEKAIVAAVAHRHGISINDLIPHINSPWINRRFIERSVYEGRRTFPRISQNFPTFEAWVKENVEGDIIWDEIEQIYVEPYEGYVYDITVEDHSHNFIANGLIVSNCGVRLLTTTLSEKDVRPRLSDLATAIFHNVPSGLGSHRRDFGLTFNELDRITREGVPYLVAKGYGWPEDIKHCEEEGCMPGANPDKVSSVAKRRGQPELGTLGSGNHFLEIQRVDRIFNARVAKGFGITHEGQITVMIHCGSRGYGHQICSDYLRVMERAVHKYRIELPDRELACAPGTSSEAQDYYQAMACAVNYAFANRQMITHWVRHSFEQIFKTSADKLGLHLIYDVAHNIAKIEEHTVDNKTVKVWVHRKGATRAFPPGHRDIPADYRSLGQPVIIPGSMGTSSWILVGTPKAMEITFGSTAHGAGRMLSRAAATRRFAGGEIKRSLESRGIVVRAASMTVLAEEADPAYKNVDRVAEVSNAVGIATYVARLVPLAVVKG